MGVGAPLVVPGFCSFGNAIGGFQEWLKTKKCGCMNKTGDGMTVVMVISSCY